ncbi:hypothetical protein AB4238_05940 [Shewanella sp. 10N.286.45.A1]|uniref:hypothetical protein n=1 Tax=Shewanella sp. 10N.286.45.A1 TaxID=3229694 RepID=UPI00354D2703
MTRQIFIIIALTFSTLVFSSNSFAADSTAKVGHSDGEIAMLNGQAIAWDAENEQWLSIDDFWQHWADSRGGITWGHSKDYPPYDQVKEQDTFLVELDGGTCLMEFWHSRWRRANDVRRWDDSFNDYSACPHVFD